MKNKVIIQFAMNDGLFWVYKKIEGFGYRKLRLASKKEIKESKK